MFFSRHCRRDGCGVFWGGLFLMWGLVLSCGGEMVFPGKEYQQYRNLERCYIVLFALKRIHKPTINCRVNKIILSFLISCQFICLIFFSILVAKSQSQRSIDPDSGGTL